MDPHPPPAPQGFEMDLRLVLLSCLGCIALFVGIASPLITTPEFGTVTLFRLGLDITLMLAGLCTITVLMALFGMRRTVLATGLALLLLVALGFASLNANLSPVRDRIEAYDAKFGRTATGVAITSVEYEYGWALLLGGAAMILLAGLTGRSASSRER